jgi:hypothetical protein
MPEEDNAMLKKEMTVTPKAVAANEAFVSHWLKSAKALIADGELPWLVNNYTPFEILQAMDIPYIELDGPSAYYFVGEFKNERSAGKKAILRDSLTALGKCGQCRPVNMPDLDCLPEFAGLIIRQYECIGNNRLLQKLCEINKKPLFFIERASTMPFYPKYPDWWKRAEDNWESVLNPAELKHYVDQHKNLIRFLEIHSGKVFRMSRLEEVLNRVNETCHYQRKIRELIARTHPAPVGIADSVNVYSTFQHHGEPGVTEVMKVYYEEILDRVENGLSLCPDEKLRLYWCKGAWYTNMSYYRKFEEKYGAVFTASWYMNLGADAYPRSLNADPLASMVSRRLFQGNYEGPQWDFLNAKFAGCQGAVMHKRQMAGLLCYNTAELGTMRESYKEHFDRNGIPMLLIDPDRSIEEQYRATGQFIERLLAKHGLSV